MELEKRCRRCHHLMVDTRINLIDKPIPICPNLECPSIMNEGERRCGACKSLLKETRINLIDPPLLTCPNVKCTVVVGGPIATWPSWLRLASITDHRGDDRLFEIPRSNRSLEVKDTNGNVGDDADGIDYYGHFHFEHALHIKVFKPPRPWSPLALSSDELPSQTDETRLTKTGSMLSLSKQNVIPTTSSKNVQLFESEIEPCPQLSTTSTTNPHQTLRSSSKEDHFKKPFVKQSMKRHHGVGHKENYDRTKAAVEIRRAGMRESLKGGLQPSSAVDGISGKENFKFKTSNLSELSQSRSSHSKGMEVSKRKGKSKELKLTKHSLEKSKETTSRKSFSSSDTLPDNWDNKFKSPSVKRTSKDDSTNDNVTDASNPNPKRLSFHADGTFRRGTQSKRNTTQGKLHTDGIELPTSPHLQESLNISWDSKATEVTFKSKPHPQEPLNISQGSKKMEIPLHKDRTGLPTASRQQESSPQGRKTTQTTHRKGRTKLPTSPHLQQSDNISQESMYCRKMETLSKPSSRVSKNGLKNDDTRLDHTVKVGESANHSELKLKCRMSEKLPEMPSEAKKSKKECSLVQQCPESPSAPKTSLASESTVNDRKTSEDIAVDKNRVDVGSGRLVVTFALRDRKCLGRIRVSSQQEAKAVHHLLKVKNTVNNNKSSQKMRATMKARSLLSDDILAYIDQAFVHKDSQNSRSCDHTPEEVKSSPKKNGNRKQTAPILYGSVNGSEISVNDHDIKLPSSDDLDRAWSEELHAKWPLQYSKGVIDQNDFQSCFKTPLPMKKKDTSFQSYSPVSENKINKELSNGVDLELVLPNNMKVSVKSSRSNDTSAVSDRREESTVRVKNQEHLRTDASGFVEGGSKPSEEKLKNAKNVSRNSNECAMATKMLNALKTQSKNKNPIVAASDSNLTTSTTKKPSTSSLVSPLPSLEKAFVRGGRQETRVKRDLERRAIKRNKLNLKDLKDRERQDKQLIQQRQQEKQDQATKEREVREERKTYDGKKIGGVLAKMFSTAEHIGGVKKVLNTKSQSIKVVPITTTTASEEVTCTAALTTTQATSNKKHVAHITEEERSLLDDLFNLASDVLDDEYNNPSVSLSTNENVLFNGGGLHENNAVELMEMTGNLNFEEEHNFLLDF